MRINISFSCENNIIPVDYRRIFISFLKKSLTDYEEGIFYKDFYENNVRKEFSFGIKFINPIFKKNHIEVSEKKISMIISSEDYSIFLILYNAIANQKNKPFKIKNNFFICENIKIYKEKEFNENAVLFRFLSPLCIREHNKDTNKDTYFSIDDDEFEEKFITMLKQQLPQKYKSSLNNFKFIPINAKKTVIKIFDLSIPVTIGEIVFQGDNNLLNYFYKNGIGSRKNAGFGLLEIVR